MIDLGTNSLARLHTRTQFWRTSLSNGKSSQIKGSFICRVFFWQRGVLWVGHRSDASIEYCGTIRNSGPRFWSKGANMLDGSKLLRIIWNGTGRNHFPIFKIKSIDFYHKISCIYILLWILYKLKIVALRNGMFKVIPGELSQIKHKIYDATLTVPSFKNRSVI